MLMKLYNMLIRLLYPLAISRYIEKRKKIGKEDLKRFHERIGRPTEQRPKGKLIWMHGASVGESISMLPLIERLLQIYPEAHIMVTTGTTTSAEVMAKRLPERAFHQYLPIDHPVFVTRFLKHWQPDIALWFESEFWPAMLSGIKHKNIPLILINGRISNKSFKRWQQFEFVIKELLDCFTLCLGQSEEDAYRLRMLGAKNTLCLGNLKYAGLPLPVDEKIKNDMADRISGRPCWLVSSTHDDEEYKIGRFLKEMRRKIPGLITFIAPRHPNRGAEIKEKLERDCHLDVALRSKGEMLTDKTEVYIADTIGEMGIWYSLFPLVFVGGSLIPHGGQNFMEPSRCRDAVIVGPHMHNFTDAMNRAKKADAIIQVNDVLDLVNMAQNLLLNPELLEAKRSLAYNWANGEAKILDGIAEKIKEYLD